MDIKLVEAYLKRVIKAADNMYAAVYSEEWIDDAIISDMQMAADQYHLAKKLFVVAAKEYHKHADECNRYHNEIYSKKDEEYYNALETYGLP